MIAPESVLLAWSALLFWVLGQIWFVQLVVYPLFARVGVAEYAEYHRFYSNRIALPVILPGFASFLLPLAVVRFGPPMPAWMSAVNVVAGIVGLLATVLLLIPRHARLHASGRSEATIEALVRYNWVRTLSITTQACVTAAMAHRAFQSFGGPSP